MATEMKCLIRWVCSSEERLKFQQALLTLPPVQMMILVCCASEVCFSLSEVSKCHPCGTVAGSILLMTNIFHLAQARTLTIQCIAIMTAEVLCVTVHGFRFKQRLRSCGFGLHRGRHLSQFHRRCVQSFGHSL